ncbi:hypothetical protein ACER0C_003339 [Sarotherodon galilaeus]
MSAFRPNNAVDQSARASSPDLFESHSGKSSINPAVFRGDLEAILPAEPSLPIGERPRREDDVSSVSAHRENCGEISFKTQEEQEDDVVFVTAYRENCRTIPFKSEAVIENIPVQTSATDGRAEERENIPVQTHATDDREEEERARRRLHKRRILGDLKFMYAITVRAYESI